MSDGGRASLRCGRGCQSAGAKSNAVVRTEDRAAGDRWTW